MPIDMHAKLYLIVLKKPDKKKLIYVNYENLLRKNFEKINCRRSIMYI